MPEVKANGVRLHYEIVGAGNIPLILLNGIAMSVSHWKPVIEALGPDYRILCHDMRGQTLSEKPDGSYSLELHAEDLAELIQITGFGSSHVVGTSYGAEVALAFALSHPELCKSLVLIDGVSETDPLLSAAVDSWMLAAEHDPIVFYRTMIPWNYSSEYIQANKDALNAREAAMTRLPIEWFKGFVSMCKAFQNIDISPRLGDIGCPTRIVVGGKDILKGKAFADILHRGIRGSTIRVVEGSGHAVVIEEPLAIANEIAECIRSARQ
jgi:3-oxoadipate enol-lactonase